MTVAQRRRCFRVASFAVAISLAAQCFCEPARADEPLAAGVAIGGEIVKHERLTLDDVVRLPHVRVHAGASAHGAAADWEGVPLIEILRAAGAPTGEALRGPNLALYVCVGAADGYRAVFALAEIDPSIGHAQVILADRRDGKPLDATEGPLRLIADGDKRPARSVRQVVSIDLLRAPAD